MIPLTLDVGENIGGFLQNAMLYARSSSLPIVEYSKKYEEVQLLLFIISVLIRCQSDENLS